MIVFMTGNRRAPAFDGVSQKADRSVVIDCRKGIGHCAYAVPAQVFHEFGKGLIIATFNQGADRTLITQIIQQPFPPDRTTLIGQGCIFLIRTGIDPLAQRLSPRFFEGFTL